MNLVQKIANRIESRVEAQAMDQYGRTGRKMGAKAKSAMALEQWIGAVEGLAALNGENDENTQWVLRVTAMVIAVRGYEETQKLAREGRDADRLVEVEAEKEADINRFLKIEQ